jgi:hypothetical protein
MLISRGQKEKLHRLAYNCFRFLGIVAAYTVIILTPELITAWPGKNPSGVAGILGFGIFFPLGIPILVAIAIGLPLSLYFWRDKLLILLFLLTIATYPLLFMVNVYYMTLILLCFSVIILLLTKYGIKHIMD